jgi:hypothetical protein
VVLLNFEANVQVDLTSVDPLAAPTARGAGIRLASRVKTRGAPARARPIQLIGKKPHLRHLPTSQAYIEYTAEHGGRLPASSPSLVGRRSRILTVAVTRATATADWLEMSGKSTSTINAPRRPRAPRTGVVRLGDLSRPISLIAASHNRRSTWHWRWGADRGRCGGDLRAAGEDHVRPGRPDRRTPDQLSELQAVNNDLRSEVARLKTTTASGRPRASNPGSSSRARSASRS